MRCQKNPDFAQFLKFNNYVDCRLSRKEREALLPRREAMVREYITERVDSLSELIERTREQWVDDIGALSKSIADVRMRAQVEREDVERAISMLKEKLKKVYAIKRSP
jgi:DNA replicative helicase MCM subunit Mcm2 (Cdc46/Mcm family)